MRRLPAPRRRLRRSPHVRAADPASYGASLLAANARDILSRHALDGHALWVSDAVETVLGRTAQEFVSGFTDLVHSDDIASLQAALVTVQAGRSAKVSMRVRHTSGQWRWLEAQAVPWRDESGACVEAQFVSRDVTARVVAERAQRDAERRLELTLEHAPIGMAILDLDGHWLRVNAALCRLVGWTRDELLGKTFQDITHPDDLAEDLAYAEKLLAGEISDYAMDKRYLRSDGATVWVHLTVALLRDDDGHPMHFLKQIQDVTERRMMEESLHESVAQLTRANEALREADEMKDHVLAVVSHELRSPLTSIIGFSDLLSKRWSELDDDSRTELLGKVAAHGQHLRLLVEDLLTVSVIRAGQLSLAIGPFPLEPLLARSVATLLPGQEVRCPSDLWVLGDPQRVEQIVTNLISNAVKYGEAPYTVVAARHDEDIEICVADSGLGVPPEFVPKLFGNFAQASTGDRRLAHGTGLGLAIVRELSDAQGGRAWYVPNEPTGSRFYVRLPAAAAIGR